MRRAIAALVVGVSLPFAGATQEQPLLLFQAAVTPERTVWVGQRVTLTLTALTPVRFAAPPAFPDLAGLPHLVVLPEATTVPGTIRVGGASYAALQRSVAIFPTEAGEIALPSLAIEAEVGGPDGQPVRAQATAPAPPHRAQAPSDVADLKRLIVTPSFRLTSTTDRPPEGLRIGEALTRSIRMEADDTAAMLLPPALWGAPEGVAGVPGPTRAAGPDRPWRAARRAERARRLRPAACRPVRTAGLLRVVAPTGVGRGAGVAGSGDPPGGVACRGPASRHAELAVRRGRGRRHPFARCRRTLASSATRPARPGGGRLR